MGNSQDQEFSQPGTCFLICGAGEDPANESLSLCTKHWWPNKFSKAPSHREAWLQVLESAGNHMSISFMYLPHHCTEPWKYVAIRQALCQRNKARENPSSEWAKTSQSHGEPALTVLQAVMEQACAMCSLPSYGSTQTVLSIFTQEMKSASQASTNPFSCQGKDLLRLRSHLSSNVCMVTCCSGAGIKFSIGTPGTQTSPGARQKSMFHRGRKCPFSFSLEMWGWSSVVGFFSIMWCKLYHAISDWQQGGWLRELCRS